MMSDEGLDTFKRFTKLEKLQGANSRLRATLYDILEAIEDMRSIGHWTYEENSPIAGRISAARLQLRGYRPVRERVSGQRGTSEASGSGVSPNGTPDARDRDEGAGTPK